MNIMTAYKYSWFANLAYVNWDEFRTSTSLRRATAAIAEKVAPERTVNPDNTAEEMSLADRGVPDGDGLTNCIFAPDRRNRFISSAFGTSA